MLTEPTVAGAAAPSAHAFLAHLYRQQDNFEPHHRIEVRAFGGGEQRRRFCANTTEAAQTAREWSDLNVYVGINPRRDGDGTREGVARLVGLWADVDAKHFRDKDAALDVIAAFDLTPSLLVDSGGGYQVYYLLDRALEAHPASVAYIESLNERLRLRLGGVDKVGDVARIFRVPGTVNRKPGRGDAPVTLVSESPATYTLADFERTLPPLPPPRHGSAPDRSYEALTEAEVRAMLSCIDPLMEYHEWVGVLMSVHSIFPDERGRRLCDEWSTAAREAAGCNGTLARQPEKWGGFGRRTGYGPGTLVHFAAEGGYQFPKHTPTRVRVGGAIVTADGLAMPEGVVPRWERLIAGHEAPAPEEMPLAYRTIAAHVAPIACWAPTDWTEMLTTAFWSALWPQVKFENLGLNVWALGAAIQGVGKSILANELYEVVAGANLLLQEDIELFTSGSPEGTVRRLDGEGKRLLGFWSEFTGFLKHMKSSYNQGVKELWCNLYDGQDIAHVKVDGGWDARHPYVVAVGVTNSGTLGEYGERGDFTNGYLSRFLICAPNVIDRAVTPFTDTAPRRELAEWLAEFVAGRRQITRARFAGGRTPDLLAAYMADLGIDTGRVRNLDAEAHRDDDLPTGRLVARVKKVAALLALAEEEVVTEDEETTILVPDRDLALAIAIVARGAAYAVRAMGWIGGTDENRAAAKIAQRLLKQRGVATKHDFAHLDHLKSVILNPTLTMLTECGFVSEQSTGRSLIYTLTDEGRRWAERQ